MTRQQCETANARSRNFCRQAALSLIAAGTVYAAPIIMPLNEALAATQPSSAIAASQSADGVGRSEAGRWSRDDS